jgi:hypothetical protein
MSVGPLGGVAANAAGAPLAQTKGSEIDRSQQAVAQSERRASNELRAETAAGIGEADGEDHEAAERDANGRRLWEVPAGNKPPAPEEAPQPARQSKDASGQRGTLLDLTG